MCKVRGVFSDVFSSFLLILCIVKVSLSLIVGVGIFLRCKFGVFYIFRFLSMFSFFHLWFVLFENLNLSRLS